MIVDQAEIDLARAAFVAAHNRFGLAHASGSHAQWYAALGETLWWVFAIDEHYRHRNQHRYEVFRDADDNGRVIAGLRLARNRVGHELSALLVDPRSSGSGVSLDQLRWKTLEALPPAGDRERPGQRAAYVELLAGEPARYALRRSNRFFIGQRQQIEDALANS